MGDSVWAVRVTAVADGVDEPGFKGSLLFDLLLGSETAPAGCWCVGLGIPS